MTPTADWRVVDGLTGETRPQPASQRRGGGDEGSAIVLILGLIVVCFLALGVVVDVSTVYLARRSLQAQADAAALAGAQAIDLDHYYAYGASEEIRLEPIAVRSAVERFPEDYRAWIEKSARFNILGTNGNGSASQSGSEAAAEVEAG